MNDNGEGQLGLFEDPLGMSDEERAFFFRCRKEISPRGKGMPRLIMREKGFKIERDRAFYYLAKWYREGWLNYRKSLDDGWMTKKGLEVQVR